MMKPKTLRNSFLLVLTALIWGVAFVAQTSGGDAIGSFSFNGVRNLLGTLAVLIVIPVLDKMNLTTRTPHTREEKKFLWKAGILIGVVFFFATNLQQLGIQAGASTSEAGFLTTCYAVIVPILGLFLGKKCGLNIWIGVFLTIAGLYLLCINGPFHLQPAQILVLLCAFTFSIHILCIDHFSPLLDGVRLSMIQFLVNGILSITVALIWEADIFHGGFGSWLMAFSNPQAWVSLLYAAICSSGIAYTLQIIGQQDVNPTVASLLMSLESVFAALAGWVILHQTLTLRQVLGCLLIFTAVVLAQLPFDKWKQKPGNA